MDDSNKTHAARERFLLAAEQVYVRCGYEGTTIRAVTAEANTSLARLSRHWSGKRELFAEVFERNLSPIHQEQFVRFDRLEKLPVDERTAAAILEAFFVPAMAGAIEDGGERLGHRVYCRALLDPAAEVSEIIFPMVAPVRGRFVGLLRQSLPHFDDDAFFLVCTIVFGAYTYPQVNGRRLAEAMGREFAAIDWRRAGGMIATMLANGIDRQA